MLLEDGWKCYFFCVVCDKFYKFMVIVGNICILQVVEDIFVSGDVDFIVIGCGLIVELEWVQKV